MTAESKNAQGPEPRVADTIEAAAGLTGYTETFLRHLKGKGVPAFRSGRIYVDELEAYYEENRGEMEKLEKECDDLDGVDAELQRERLRKARLANDQAAGLLIEKADVARRVEPLAVELKNMLRRALEDDLPRELVGKSEEQIRIKLTEVVDELIQKLHDGTEWTRS
jgi:hypothetical protein